jgi:hypothetical protein
MKKNNTALFHPPYYIFPDSVHKLPAFAKGLLLTFSRRDLVTNLGPETDS